MSYDKGWLNIAAINAVSGGFNTFVLLAGWSAIVWATVLAMVFGYFIMAYSLYRAFERVALEYDKRWENDAYVKMIHATQVTERRVFGEIRTECEAPCHKQNALPTPPKGRGAGSMVIVGDHNWLCVEDQRRIRQIENQLDYIHYNRPKRTTTSTGAR